MKKISTLLIFLALVVVAYIYVQKDSHHREVEQERASEVVSNRGSNKNVTYNDREVSSSENEKKSSIDTVKDDRTRRGPDRPTWKDAFAIYSPPVENLSDEVERIRESLREYSSGEAEFKLFRIAEYCEQAPKTESDLREMKSMYEESSLMAGQDNSEIMENLDRAENHFSECKNLEKAGLLSSYDYLEVSAQRGSAVAKSVLATAAVPDQFEAWSPEEREDYKARMEKYLNEARDSCEPRAFHAFAYGIGEGDTWVDTSGIPSSVRKYSNLLSHGMIYKNKSSDSEQIVNSIYTKLHSMRPDMGEEAVAQAEMYGRHLYSEACE